MGKKVFVTVFSAIFVFFFWSLPGIAGDLDAFKGLSGTLRIAGGTAHIPVQEEAARRIMEANPEILITIAGGGTGLGIKQAGEGLVDIGNAGRKPTDEEVSRYSLQVFRWATDGVAVIVHPSNAVRGLAKADIKGIFAGKIDNWKAVGGMDHAINLYTRPEESGTREVFWQKALDKGEISSGASVMKSNGAMKAAVSSDPYAIGYLSAGYLDPSVKALPVDGAAPTPEAIVRGSYPVSRGLFSVIKGAPTPLAKAFLDFLASPTGQEIVREKGFLPPE